MKCNIGVGDRWFRILGGLFVIIVLGWFFQNWWALVGVALLATGIFKFCPLYVLFKFDSGRKP
jgi:hypothetical protein